VDRNRKIVFIGFDIEGTGGISTYSRYQIKALKEEFSDIFVYSFDQQDKSYSGYVDISYVYTSKARLLTFLIELIRKRGDIDFIIFNHVNLSFLGALLKKIFNIKYMIFGYNNDILLDFKHLYKFGYENTEALGIDCKYTINRLKEFHSVLPKTYLLYDPIDIDFFKKNNKNKSQNILSEKYKVDFDNKFIITTVALMRKSGNKGHRLIIDAIKKLNNPNILYLITSGGEDKKNIEQYVENNNMENQVIFFGFVENELIPHFYNASDIVSLISKSEYGKGEGVPLGLIEASSCEVPVLAGDEDGSIEAISDKYQNGFRVSPRNIDEITEKVQYYIDNPEMKTIHGQNGRKFVIEEFEYSKFRDTQTRIFNEILND
jgi:glycosyltransferase involved in cell wall biosynthesis